MADFYVVNRDVDEFELQVEDPEMGVAQPHRAREDKSTNKEMADPRADAPGHVRYFRLIRFMSAATFTSTWRQLSPAEEEELLPDGDIGTGPFTEDDLDQEPAQPPAGPAAGLGAGPAAEAEAGPMEYDLGVQAAVLRVAQGEQARRAREQQRQPLRDEIAQEPAQPPAGPAAGLGVGPAGEAEAGPMEYDLGVQAAVLAQGEQARRAREQQRQPLQDEIAAIEQQLALGGLDDEATAELRRRRDNCAAELVLSYGYEINEA